MELRLAHQDSSHYSAQMRQLDLLILLLMAAASEGLAQPAINPVALDKLFAEGAAQHSSSLFKTASRFGRSFLTPRIIGFICIR